MRVRITFITRDVAGGVEHSEKRIDATELTIGRATDQVLHIRDRRARLQHAKIVWDKGGPKIESTALTGVVVNGRSTREARLAVGDVIEVGANVMRVVAPADSTDFAMTFELREDAKRDDLAPVWSGTRVDDALSMRRLSWAAALAVLVLGFAIPAAGLLSPGIAELLRATPVLPDDGFWLSGPVHSAHATFGSECESCHLRAFERVPDTACGDCHEAARHVALPGTAVLGATRCASCHLEHNEPPALVKSHQGLCTDCHRDGELGASLAPVSDFLHAHPGFSVSLLEQQADSEWLAVRQALVDAPVESSNLKFDHAVHLDPGGIMAPTGTRIVDCADCHLPDPGGARMQPISMDQHCLGCHTLSFDADDPERQVPHGDPAAVVQTLVEYYSARLLGDDADNGNQRLRRPGQSLTRADRDRAAAEARSRALSIAEDLFERRACFNCHEVTRVQDDDVLWSVQPVRLTGVFMPHADFSHAAHDTEVVDCAGCHSAGTSASATDVLMPDVGVCHDCHGSGVARRNRANQIVSTCIQCHGFHSEAKGLYPAP